MQRDLDIVKKFFGKFQKALWHSSALLGDGAGNVAVLDRPGWDYARMPDNSSIQVFNGGRFPEEEDQLVEVGYTISNPKLLQILEVRQTFQDALPYAVQGKHAPRHTHLAENGGDDVTWIDSRQWMPMRVGPGGGLTVQIYRTVIWTSAGWAVVEGAVDLSAHVPSSGALYALIAFDPNGDVQITDGATVTDLLELSESDIPALPVGQTVSCAVALYDGQTEILESQIEQDFVDLRVSGAPNAATPDINASYITVDAETALPDSRQLSDGNLIILTDGGAGSTLGVAVDSTKLTISSGKMDKTGAGTLTLAAGASVTLTVDASMELDPTGAISGQLLQYNGTKWIPATLTLTHNLLSTTHPDTVAASPVRGDLIVANSTPAWQRLALGATGRIPQSDGSDLVYVAISGDATIAAGGAITLANTAVTPGTYGNATNVAQITVDSKGRLTAASNVAISLAAAGGWTDDGTIVRLTTSTDAVGIGTSSPSGKLMVTESYTDPASDSKNINVVASGNITANNANRVIGLLLTSTTTVSSTFTASNTSGAVTGIDSTATVSIGGGTVASAYALMGSVRVISSSTLTVGAGLRIPAGVLSLGGSITNLVGAHISTQGDGVNNAEIILGNTTPTGNWALYANAGHNSYFSNSVGIGSSTISAMLHVTSTTEQARLGYDASNYASFTVSSAGVLTIAPTGTGGTNITGTLGVSGHAAFGGSASVSTTTIGILSETLADPAGSFGLQINPTVTLTSNNANVFDGVRVLAFLDQGSSNATSTVGIRAFDTIARATGASGTVTGATGLFSLVQNTGAGTLSNGYGLFVSTFNNTGGGTFTNAVGVAIGNQTAGTNNTLLLVGTTTAPTGNWGVYNPSTYSSHFTGNVLIGVTASFGSELLSVLAPDNGTCVGLKINATQANITAADVFAQFRSTSGVEGSIAGSGVAGVIAYNTFTGSHWAQLEIGEPEPEIGMIVSISGKMVDNSGSDRHLPFIRRSSYRQEKGVFGVFAGAVKDSGEIAHGKDGAILNSTLAIGIGVILVTSTNGDIEPGDYIQSSTEPGLGEKQDDDFLHNYTVAKSLEHVTWKDEKESVKMISCTYHCG